MTKTTVYTSTGHVIAKWNGGASCAGLGGDGDPNDILGALMYGGHMVVTSEDGIYIYSMRVEKLPTWAKLATPDVAQMTYTQKVVAEIESAIVNNSKGGPDVRD